jgi:hypothetical protein
MGQPVRTSLGLPKWITGAADWPRLWEATPRGWYFGAHPEAFEDAYLDQLERYGPKRIAARLAAITRETGAQTLLLCCFEPLPTDCHRGLFAQWWLHSVGEVIAEITSEENAS